MKISYFNSLLLLLNYEKNSFLLFSFLLFSFILFYFILFIRLALTHLLTRFIHLFKSGQLIHFQVAAANDAMPSLLQGRF
jgi:hypothetical protein